MPAISGTVPRPKRSRLPDPDPGDAREIGASVRQVNALQRPWSAGVRRSGLGATVGMAGEVVVVRPAVTCLARYSRTGIAGIGVLPEVC